MGTWNKSTLTQWYSWMLRFKWNQNKMTSFRSFGTIRLHTKDAADGVPTRPIHYKEYRSRFQLCLFSAPLHLSLWLCGLKVCRGQWIWLLRLGAACHSCNRKWASPMGSVCHRRSNRPPGNLPVPTLSIRGLYLDQSGRAVWQWRGIPCTFFPFVFKISAVLVLANRSWRSWKKESFPLCVCNH